MKKHLLLFYSSFLFIFLISHAQTMVPGGNVSGTWTLAGSPYEVQSSIMIPKDSSLKIEPGVKIIFKGHYKLLVLGNLQAVGTAKELILFTAADSVTGWYGIRFDNTAAASDSSRIAYCQLEWGIASNTSGTDQYGGALLFNNFSKINMHHCIIRKCSNYQIYCINSKPIITQCDISYSKLGGGIILNGPETPVILNNTISYNQGQGIVAYLSETDHISIIGNTISYNGETGIYCTKAEFTISKNRITNNNTGKYSVGGIWCDHATGTINNNTICCNYSNNSGYSSGIFLYFTGGTVFNNYIANNIGMNGAGIFCVGPSDGPTLSNNVIVNNTAGEKGGAIFCMDQSPVLINNTIANNHAVSGGGLACTGTSNPILKNCILFGNTASGEGSNVFLNDETSDPAFNYCDVEGGSMAFGLNGNFYTGSYMHNISILPMFVLSSIGSGANYNGLVAKWSLDPSSPCINKGDAAGPYPATDIAGNPRIVGEIIDMGAYELQAVGIRKNELSPAIVVSPNPFSNETKIHFSEPVKQPEFRIFNTQGQCVKSNLSGNGNVFSISRDELPTGIYFLQVISEGKAIATERLIITD